MDRFLARVPHQKYDIAYDEAAKAIWRRKNGGSTELPLILVSCCPYLNKLVHALTSLDQVDGTKPGSIEQLEDA